MRPTLALCLLAAHVPTGLPAQTHLEPERGILAVWEHMLLRTRHPDAPRQGLDGTTYHFSAFIKGRGVLAGKIWSPDANSPTHALTALAAMMANFAQGTVDSAALESALERAETAASE